MWQLGNNHVVSLFTRLWHCCNITYGVGTKPGLWTLDWTVDWTAICTNFVFLGIPVVTIAMALYACFLCLTFSVLIYFIEHDCCFLNITCFSFPLHAMYTCTYTVDCCISTYIGGKLSFWMLRILESTRNDYNSINGKQCCIVDK